jgi:hypothetical protein
MEGLHNPLLWAQIATVAALWALVALGIRHWGPGRRQSAVYCPETSMPMKVTVLHKEADWGTFRPADIVACSRFAGTAVACDKKCLAQI